MNALGRHRKSAVFWWTVTIAVYGFVVVPAFASGVAATASSTGMFATGVVGLLGSASALFALAHTGNYVERRWGRDQPSTGESDLHSKVMTLVPAVVITIMGVGLLVQVTRQR